MMSAPLLVKSAKSGMEAKSTNLDRSQTTMVNRRSNRSAMTPAIGPSTSAGSSRTAITPPNAPPLAGGVLTLGGAARGGGEREGGGGEGGGGGGAERGPERGEAEDDPQPAERPDAQDRAQGGESGEVLVGVGRPLGVGDAAPAGGFGVGRRPAGLLVVG